MISTTTTTNSSMQHSTTTKCAILAIVVALILIVILSGLQTTTLAFVRQHLILLAGSVVALTATKHILQFVARRQNVHQIFKRGNVPEIGRPKLLSGNLDETYFKPDNVFIVDSYHKKLGPTFGLFAGPDPWIQTSDLELLRRIFLAEGAIHVDKTQFNSPFVREFNESILQARGDKWRFSRRIIAPSLHQKQLRADNVHNDIDTVGKQLMEFIEARRRAQEDPGRPVKLDVLQAMRCFSLEVLFRVAFGRTYIKAWDTSERNEVLDMVREAEKLVSSRFTHLSVMIPQLRHFMGRFLPLTKLGPFFSGMSSILDESLRVRRELMLASAGQQIESRDRKMIDSLVEASQSGKMDDDTLKANLLIILMAGHETTSFTLIALLFTLAWHQDKQDKLRREIRAHGEQAEYLSWCIDETTRLYPAGPSGHGRILEHDMEHKGMKLFRGTSVNPTIWTIQHSQQYWGQDADQFRPERMGEPVDEQRFPAIKMRLFAFGHGPRNCPGQSLARAEMRDLLAKLIVRFKISPSPTTPRELDCTSPNLIHWIVHCPVELELSAI